MGKNSHFFKTPITHSFLSRIPPVPPPRSHSSRLLFSRAPTPYPPHKILCTFSFHSKCKTLFYSVLTQYFCFQVLVSLFALDKDCPFNVSLRLVTNCDDSDFVLLTHVTHEELAVVRRYGKTWILKKFLPRVCCEKRFCKCYRLKEFYKKEIAQPPASP